MAPETDEHVENCMAYSKCDRNGTIKARSDSINSHDSERIKVSEVETYTTVTSTGKSAYIRALAVGTVLSIWTTHCAYLE